MSDPSITEEIAEIRRVLSSLQARLHTLESAVSLTSLKPTNVESPPLISNECRKKKKSIVLASSVSDPATKKDLQTLRSRSFRVMRHLINVVDASFLDQEPLKKSKVHQKPATSQKPSTSKSNDIKGDPPVLLSVLNHPKSDPTVQDPTRARLHEVEIKETPKSTSGFHSPRVFHPKRPRKDTKKLSHPISSVSHSQLPRKYVTPLEKPSVDEMTTTDANQKKQMLPASPAQRLKHVNTEDEDDTTTGLFKYNLLAKHSNRFGLLKCDPSASDLLPIPGKNHRFIITPTQVETKDLDQASASLIQKQTLGVWEWKESTSMVQLYECKIPTSKETTSKGRFKYVGWAWKGKLDQQPPKIQDLPEDIHQGCDTLRWYWFKDRWLLFYF